MGKIFRLHSSGSTSFTDWNKIDGAIGDQQIKQIADPAQASAKKQITSIPSPFARMDLFLTAFSIVGESTNTLDGKTIHHKLVSDSLDIAQLFFELAGFHNNSHYNLEIIPYDFINDLNKLLTQNNPWGEKILGETLQLYYEQDSKTYNFDLLNKIYILKLNSQVIGATSPVTLFFTTANKIFADNITFGNDTLFDDDYRPLYRREKEFQKYIYMLFKGSSELRNRMRTFYEYLEKCKEKLRTEDNGLFSQIEKLNASEYMAKLPTINYGNETQLVEIFDIPLKRKPPVTIASGFTIKPTKEYIGALPLVLQKNMNIPVIYINDEIWDKKVEVPNLDELPLKSRMLPGQTGVKHPYLVVSDFLEPYLVRCIFPLNKDCFFDGNVTLLDKNEKYYLLPIKPLFFEFFNVEDLKGTVNPGNLKMIEIGETAGNAVKVILRIPIEDNRYYISFERTYYENKGGKEVEPSPEQNKGVIIESPFSLSIFPFIRCNENEIPPHYHIQMIERDHTQPAVGREYNLEFYKNDAANQISKLNQDVYRSRKNHGKPTTYNTKYFVLSNNFDLIKVKTPVADAYLVPLWKEYQGGTDEFHFAIDFGTTNTHIEYKKGIEAPKTLEFSAQDSIAANLFHPTKSDKSLQAAGAVYFKDVLEWEFLPPQINSQSNYKFPQRTVLLYSKNTNFNADCFAPADMNVGFIYEKKSIRESEDYTSNLKWGSKDSFNEKKVSAFFLNLILLIRVKIIQNGGSLPLTKIIWFYPTSMEPGHIDKLNSLWDKLCGQYLSKDVHPKSISESLAPFYFYKKNSKIAGGSFNPVISVDIGGGTTDVVIFQQNSPQLITSFKFAGNSLFGNGLGEEFQGGVSGIAKKYVPYFKNILDNNKNDVSSVFNGFLNNSRGEDLNAFLFSLEKSVQLSKEIISYNEVLSKDEHLKIVFLYFYSAIMYHIATLMYSWQKKRGGQIQLPRDIVFSGTGSKILNIITENDKRLEDLTKAIFEKVFNKHDGSNKYEFAKDGLSVTRNQENPKELTAKGGLLVNPKEMVDDIAQIKQVYYHFGKLNGESKIKLKDLSSPLLKELVEEIKEFNKLFLSLNELSQIEFKRYFLVSDQSFELFRDKINNDLDDYAHDARINLQNIYSDDNTIEETLFFYPLIGSIFNIVDKHLTEIN